jgi:hypothetical protein
MFQSADCLYATKVNQSHVTQPRGEERLTFTVCLTDTLYRLATRQEIEVARRVISRRQTKQTQQGVVADFQWRKNGPHVAREGRRQELLSSSNRST